MKFPDKKNSLILVIAVIVLLIPVILLETNLLRQTNGNISYPLDSSFLNISTAKNLAFYKVWGVSKYTFQPATASLLYPFVLALIFFIAGAHLIIPVILNTIMAILFLYTLQQAFIRRQIEPATQAILLLGTTLITALPLLVVSGTETVLQLLLCLLFIDTLIQTLHNSKSKLPRRVYQYAFLAVAARYDNLLLILLIAILLHSLNRRREALKLTAIAITPIVIFGGVSLIKGSYFLPTPLVTGSYPLYLVTLTIIAFGIALLLILKHHRPVTAATVMALPLIVQSVPALAHFTQDSVRIYEQQYPIAAFVHRYYQRGTIGANDVAALTYFSDGRKIDYSGATGADIDSLTRKNGVSTAILSDSSFESGAPSNWFRIASWDMPDARPGATRTFTFYSVYRWDSVLQRRLRDFQPLLPTRISVRYY
ncbi:MAG TPA: hypothetical protein VHE34_25835 [Puia sp.]|uniref:hypothetical protein n=1 Tax=Puia sp. TaxID=2045100 RepID=UPI002C3385EF|nr:hypothetical protein [Puia sp.]HVU98680.1 hypothetical protein [Puia sp.]